jgi:hypothetical protein
VKVEEEAYTLDTEYSSICRVPETLRRKHVKNKAGDYVLNGTPKGMFKEKME